MWNMCKVMDNEKLVHYVLKRTFKINRYSDKYEDMYQVGMIGLIKAANNFDESLGYKFSTYAIMKIEGEIKRDLRDGNAPMKVSRELKLVASMVLKMCPDTSLLEDSNWLEEISKRVNVEIGTIRAAIDMHYKVNFMQSVDMTVTSGCKIACDKERTLQEAISDDTINIQKDVEINLLLEKALHSLDHNQAEVLRMYYMGDMTQSEIGKALGISQVQVSRLMQRGLQNARNTLISKSTVSDINGLQITEGNRQTRKDANLIEYNGIVLTITEWAKTLSIPRATIYRRFKQGLSPASCLGLG